VTPNLPQWSDLDHLVSMENKLGLYEAYTANNGNIFESNEPTNIEAFDRLAGSGDTLAVNSKGLVITLVLMNNELSVAQGPELVKLIEKRPNSYLLELLEQENRVVEFPIKTKSVSVPIITLLFKTVESYDKLNTFVTMTFGKVLPKYEDKNITENKMSSIMKGLVDEGDKIKGADGKACWKGYRYAGTEKGKDKCVPVKNESAYEADLGDNEPRVVIGVYGAKSKEFRKKFANQKAQDRFFDHPDREGNYEIHYVQKADVSEGENIDRKKLRKMSDEELSAEIARLEKNKSPRSAAGHGSWVGQDKDSGAARTELMRRRTSRPKPNMFNEGVITQHDAEDPEVAIIGGAGTMSLSRLKKKAHGEALQLADDIANGKYSASSYNMKQLHNTLNTIVAAEKEMEKNYFGEDFTGMFAAEKTPATNPYGGQKDIQQRGSLGEDSS
jgi:hypothetical protein